MFYSIFIYIFCVNSHLFERMIMVEFSYHGYRNNDVINRYHKEQYFIITDAYSPR